MTSQIVISKIGSLSAARHLFETHNFHQLGSLRPGVIFTILKARNEILGRRGHQSRKSNLAFGLPKVDLVNTCVAEVFEPSVIRNETSVPDEANLWSQVQARLDGRAAWGRGQLVSEVIPEPLERYGNPVLVKPRLGQGAFRVLVTDAYRRRCALTGESTLPVLEAAHILPFAEGGPHDLSNGMFLRSDFHKLFDLGMITVTPEYRIEVSPRIKEDWFNGKAYYRLHGLPLTNLPESVAERPAPEFLRWHNDHRFQR